MCLHRQKTMQTDTNIAGDLPPIHTLDRLIDLHGTRAVLRALVMAMIRRRKALADAGTLPDHLRRDIGLPERNRPPPRLRGPMM